MDLFEFKATLGYTERWGQVVLVHIFNPSNWKSHAFNLSTREVETGKDMAGQREEYKAEGDRSSIAFSLRILGGRIALSSV